jgi:hypothetical protein
MMNYEDMQFYNSADAFEGDEWASSPGADSEFVSSGLGWAGVSGVPDNSRQTKDKRQAAAAAAGVGQQQGQGQGQGQPKSEVGADRTIFEAYPAVFVNRGLGRFGFNENFDTSNPEHVKQLQTLLYGAKLYDGNIDGIFGDKSIAATGGSDWFSKVADYGQSQIQDSGGAGDTQAAAAGGSDEGDEGTYQDVSRKRVSIDSELLSRLPELMSQYGTNFADAYIRATARPQASAAAQKNINRSAAMQAAGDIIRHIAEGYFTSKGARFYPSDYTKTYEGLNARQKALSDEYAAQTALYNKGLEQAREMDSENAKSLWEALIKGAVGSETITDRKGTARLEDKRQANRESILGKQLENRLTALGQQHKNALVRANAGYNNSLSLAEKQTAEANKRRQFAADTPLGSNSGGGGGSSLPASLPTRTGQTGQTAETGSAPVVTPTPKAKETPKAKAETKATTPQRKSAQDIMRELEQDLSRQSGRQKTKDNDLSRQSGRQKTKAKAKANNGELVIDY